jgi:hypothetical protein
MPEGERGISDNLKLIARALSELLLKTSFTMFFPLNYTLETADSKICKLLCKAHMNKATQF